VFLGVAGIDPVAGLTDFDMEEIRVKRQMIRCAREVIVLADHSKFGRVAPLRTAPLDAVHRVVTDAGISDTHRRTLEESGIGVTVAPPVPRRADRDHAPGPAAAGRAAGLPAKGPGTGACTRARPGEGVTSMAPRLITMLTRNDRTVSDAEEVFAGAPTFPAEYWASRTWAFPPGGCVPWWPRIKAAGKTAVLRWSLSGGDCLAAARLALDCGFDYLMGTVYYDSASSWCAGRR